jgi:dCMP deaminase
MFRIKQALSISELSPCGRGKVGAVIFDPNTYAVIADGYNGAPRGGGRLCGGEVCIRTEQRIPSGTSCEIGCHHAEVNAISNAARLGHSTHGAHMAVSCSPCLMCAKMIHHVGITRVYFLEGTYSGEGADYLTTFLGETNVREVGAAGLEPATGRL